MKVWKITNDDFLKLSQVPEQRFCKTCLVFCCCPSHMLMAVGSKQSLHYPGHWLHQPSPTHLVYWFGSASRGTVTQAAGSRQLLLATTYKP